MKLFIALLFFISFAVAVPPFPSSFDPFSEGFTQELWGYGQTTNLFVGVAFDIHGDVISTVCDSKIAYRYAPSTVVEHGSTIHPSTQVTMASNDPSITAGCALINHPDGNLYYAAIYNGIIRLNPETYERLPLPGTSAPARLGMGVDPKNANKIFYVRYGGGSPDVEVRIFDISTGSDVSLVTTGVYLDGLYWNAAGTLIFIADLVGNKVIVINRDGTQNATYPVSVPDGIAFHESSQTIFTNNGDGTIARINPASSIKTTFASGGFRGDQGAVGADQCWYITQAGTRFNDGFTSAFNSVVRICGGFSIPPGIAPPCNLTGGTYHTQSEGDWGDQCAEGFETGCYRDKKFDTCFPNGLDVGCSCPPNKKAVCGYHLHFDSSSDVENYLPQLGAPGVLDQDYVNPTQPPPMSTSSGNFGGQVTALALSLGFSDCDFNFHTACGKLQDLFICDKRCSVCKRNNNCKRNSGCKYLREDEEEDEIDMRTNKNTNYNNNNNGKPKYPNCEAFYAKTVGEMYDIASKLLGGCADCGAGGLSKKDTMIEDRNNKNNNSPCVQCTKRQARNNNNCSRNSNCKRNNNCCCCSTTPECDPALVNACITLINQAFIFSKTLDDVDSGTLFKEKPCECATYEWVAKIVGTGQTIVINPFVVSTSVAAYYGYAKVDADSANTPDGLEDSNSNSALVQFLLDGFGAHSLLVIYDQPNDGSDGTAISSLSHTGNLASANFLVQDDVPPREDTYTITPTSFSTSHSWTSCCTDGYDIGPIPSHSCFTWRLEATTGINQLRFASKGEATITVPKTDSETIVVNICNRCNQI